MRLIVRKEIQLLKSSIGKVLGDRHGAECRLAVAFLASATIVALATGAAEAAPDNCHTGYVAAEFGASSTNGSLTLSGDYGGAPETGGSSPGQGLVGLDVGFHLQGMGSPANVQAPPLEVLSPEVLPPAPAANRRKKQALELQKAHLEAELAELTKGQGFAQDDPVVKEVKRRINVVDGQLADLAQSWSRILEEEARRRPAAKVKAPCKGPVAGLRARLPFFGKKTSSHDIHPAPSAATTATYSAALILMPYIGWLYLLDSVVLPGGKVAVTPWLGFTFERGKLSMTTDEVGTVTSFSQNVTRQGPSVGVNVDLPMSENIFMGFGLQGDWLSGVSASGISPLFNYQFGRERSFQYGGFMRIGRRW